MSAVRDPIWEVMEVQGRTLVWLAQQTGLSESYVHAMKARKIMPTAEFRSRSAQVLQVPERLLFLDQSPSVDPDSPLSQPDGVFASAESAVS